tara:strand:- start:38 stop:709 length:672 start_codon:yes stop_codon:yes gene_type:complete
MRRFFNLVTSGLSIIFLSPLLIPITLILKFTGEGEVFFSQKRVGKDGNLFLMHKFATMLKDSPNIGTGTLTIKDDPRILPFGNFLRKTKINELPQLFNVFKGEMSIVGPRPQSPRNFAAFNKNLQNKIIFVTPGLTGLGSIFFSNEEEMLSSTVDQDLFYDSVIMPYKGELEIWYVKNLSVKVDIQIIFLTILKIIFPNFKVNLSTYFPGIPSPPNELKKILR